MNFNPPKKSRVVRLFKVVTLEARPVLVHAITMSGPRTTSAPSIPISSFRTPEINVY